MNLLPSANLILSLLTIIGQAIILLGIFLLIFKRRNFLFKLVAKNALWFSFIVVLTAMCGSLFYSEIALIQPCELCWFQRIFMYPQVFILALAILRHEKNILNYNLLLSILGAPIAIYHYLLQVGIAPNVACSITSYSISCSQNFVLQFGYISIPLMAATAFLMVILFSSISKGSGILNSRI